MAVLTINGVDVKSPNVLQVDIVDIDKESERNANGTMQRTRVATKRKLNVEWGALTNSEISKILNAVKDVFFTVRYPDPVTGVYATRTFYVGDRSAPIYRMKSGVPVWEGLKANLIEK